MRKVILDTDIFSEITTKRNVNRRVASRARLYELAHDKFTISALTILEAFFGLEAIDAIDRINPLLKSLPAFEVLDFDTESALICAKILVKLKRAGTPVTGYDPHIAAMAIRYNLPLATGNIKDYQRIVDLEFSLILENWKE